MKTGRGNDFQTVTSLLLFTRMTFFQTYHPKNKRFLTDFTRILQNLGENSFSENLTKLKKTCQKNSFWEKFAELSPTVRCTGISENQFWQYGGAYSDRQHTNKSRWKSLCRYRYPFGQTRTAERAWIRYRNRAGTSSRCILLHQAADTRQAFTK